VLLPLRVGRGTKLRLSSYVNFLQQMDEQSIQAVVNEIAPMLTGRTPGKIFQLGPASLAIDFGLRAAGYLYLSAESAAPGLYLIKRRVRDLEKQSRPLSQFAQSLRKELQQTRLVSITKEKTDRIVRLTFAGTDELGHERASQLLTQLTGSSANLLILNDRETIVRALRASQTVGQRPGDTYRQSDSTRPPQTRKPSALLEMMRSSTHDTASAAADHYFTSLLAEKQQAAQIASARAELRRKISQQQKLLGRLEQDLREHDDPEQHKRVGDLLLANLHTATRAGNRVTLIDYFSDDARKLAVEIDVSVSLPEEATRRFARYARSKRASEQIKLRQDTVVQGLRKLESDLASLDQAIAEGKLPATAAKSPGPRSTRDQQRAAPERVRGTRRYVSADGLEILVGRTSHDNDHLTFKVAKPNDLWLHAADYGGSHVVVRNSSRKEIPSRTLIEAAQLAAHFSQAKKDPKVDVHYTERKFVSKPRKAKPGLVRLERFKTILVQPKEAGTRA
jgi:predicted ribosome quality control (RQC) complex YloA/Tae2 family protein